MAEKLNELNGKTWYQYSFSIWRDIRKSKEEKQLKHPAIFPISLITRVIHIFSKKGGVILDPFMGCGSTVLAAAFEGRKAIGFDLSEEYFKVTKERMANIGLKRMRKRGIELKEAIGLSIKIDVIGILKRGNSVKLAFVEVKNKPLTLKDLGQLWGYTQLIMPIESFLISPAGLGRLEYIFNVLKREDLLVYGSRANLLMKIAKWDIERKMIDYLSMIPKI